MTKSQTLRKFWHFELFWRDLHVIWNLVIFWADQLKKPPCMIIQVPLEIKRKDSIGEIDSDSDID